MLLAAIGHRPSHIRPYLQRTWHQLAQLAERHLRTLQPQQVIISLEPGWSSIVGEMCDRNNIPLITVATSLDQPRNWHAVERGIWQHLQSIAIARHVLEEKHFPTELDAVNQFIIPRADHLLLLWNGTAGTHKGHISRAQVLATQLGKPTTNCWKEFQHQRWLSADIDKEE